MRVHFTAHALDQARVRGTDRDEILDALHTGAEDTARPGYMARAKVYPFAQQWMGKIYAQKRVRVIYVIENGDTVVVTVYAYYGSWTT